MQPVADPPITFKDVVRMATTANLAPTAPTAQTLPIGGTTLTLDGVALANGDRVLVKDQTTASQNGLYVVSGIGTSVLLTRTADAWTAGTLVSGATVTVIAGTANAGTTWMLVTAAPIVIGTTALAFTRTNPPYAQGEARDPWMYTGGGTPICSNGSRQQATAPTNITVGGLQLLAGGMVLPAGRPITNINYIALGAGAAPTVSWLAIVRQSDRVVLAHTANIITAPTINVVTTRALTGVFTSNYDVPVWIVLSYNNATTAMSLVASGAPPAALSLLAPALVGTNGVVPTTALPTDGTTVITAATVGWTASPLFWLT